jgi:hypothetical protein
MTITPILLDLELAVRLVGLSSSQAPIARRDAGLS